jgi:hypothetical protein
VNTTTPSSPEKDTYRKRSFSKGSKSPASSSNTKEPLLVFIPKREPKGPDGTNGFSADYRRAREIMLTKKYRDEE